MQFQRLLPRACRQGVYASGRRSVMIAASGSSTAAATHSPQARGRLARSCYTAWSCMAHGSTGHAVLHGAQQRGAWHCGACSALDTSPIAMWHPTSCCPDASCTSSLSPLQVSARVLATDEPCIVKTKQLMAAHPGALSLAQGIVHWQPPPSALQVLPETLHQPCCA
jgi:hypothetical protein